MCAITKQDEADLVDYATVERSRDCQKVESTIPPALKMDILAYVTQKQKSLLEYLNTRIEKALSSPFCRLATKTTQPAHIVAVLAALLVASSLAHQENAQKTHSPVLKLLFLASVSIHVGAQFWMTFISGLALYFSLPRHIFGEVQKVLFPKYFALNAILSGITMLSFGKMHQGFHWEMRHWIQACSISFCFMLELLIRLYLVPNVLKLITSKIELEKQVPGVGQEVGCHAPGKLARCPHYSRLHSSFRRHHLCVAAGNIMTMICTTLQLYYIQQNWSCLL